MSELSERISMISMNPMISKIPQGYFDKFGALKRLLGPFFKNIGPFPKNVGDFPKNDGLFLRNLRRFFFYLLVFFVLELRWNNPLVWRLWKQKVQNPCNVRAWYAHARARNQRCIWTCSSSSERMLFRIIAFSSLGHQNFQNFFEDTVLMICTHFGVFGYTFWWYVPVWAFLGTHSDDMYPFRGTSNQDFSFIEVVLCCDYVFYFRAIF